MTRARPTSHQRTPVAALTLDERQTLLRFNAYLMDLERFIVQEAERLDRTLLERKIDPRDALSDYSLEAEVSYYLRQDDPAFRDDDDNILACRTEDVTGLSLGEFAGLQTLLNDGCNYNDEPGLEDEHHCWLYHDLYAHRYGEDPEDQPLDWPDIFRIGSVWLDLKVCHQYAVTDPFAPHAGLNDGTVSP